MDEEKQIFEEPLNNYEDKIEIPDPVFSLFGEVTDDKTGEFSIRVYKIYNPREVPAFCGKFLNEEVDEEIIGEKFGTGKFKVVLHLHKTRKNFTRVVTIDDSFLSRMMKESPHKSGGSELDSMERFARLLQPFILNRPAEQKDPFINMEKIVQMFHSQMEKISLAITKMQTDKIKEIGSMHVGNIQDLDDERETPNVNNLWDDLAPFVPLILKGLIPKKTIDKVLGNMGFKDDLEAKGELFDSFCEKVKEEIGEEKAQELLKKAGIDNGFSGQS